MRLYSFSIAALFAVWGLGFWQPATSSTAPQIAQMSYTLKPETPVWDVLVRLGKFRRFSIDTTATGYSAEKGKEIVEKGYTTHPITGKKTKRQSKYFTCIACHNSSRETKDLTDQNPQSRLQYAVDNKMPFLQGSTFFGIVNREAFYNGDYQKKYGSVPDIKAANQDLRKAIHVCATQCSQGRPLEKWEMESVLAYFWTLQLQLKDLPLQPADFQKIEQAIADDVNLAQAVSILESKFALYQPATFPEEMEYRTLDSRVANDEARFKNGKNIYDLSCKHCHAGKKFSFFALDDSRKSFRYLDNKMKNGHAHSLYKITRAGTYPLTGKRAYMPQYPAEKLSNEQLIDLRVYVQKMAEK